MTNCSTALAKAERDLSFTVIRAPVDGVFSNRAVQTGDYVQTGQRVASLVPLDDVYIEANFKETQLARLRPGQPVSISVDALPEHAINGTRGEPFAGIRRGVLAAAARQRDRQFHQDRAAAAGPHRSAVRRRGEAGAAARHVGRGQRQHQADDSAASRPDLGRAGGRGRSHGDS